MSFWAGVVQGVKDIDVLKEKEALAEERKSTRDQEVAYRDRMDKYRMEQDEIASRRYEAQLAATTEQNEWSRAQAEEARVYREGRDVIGDAVTERGWNATVAEREQARADAAAEREQARADAAAERALRFNIQLLEVGGPSFAKLLAGQGGSGSDPSDINSGPVLPVGVMSEGLLGLQREVEDAGGLEDMPAASREFFETMYSDPAAATGVYSFLTAQRKEGNDINIEDLPTYINILGTSGGTGAEERRALAERIGSGNADMSDSGQFLSGLAALMAYEPVKVVWGQSRAVASPTAQRANYEAWQESTLINARFTLNAMPAGAEKTALAQTIANAGTKGKDGEIVRNEAFINLWDVFGRDAAAELGLDPSNTRLLSPYFAQSRPGQPETPTPQSTPAMPADPTTTALPAESTPTAIPSAAPADESIPSFTVQELESMTDEEIAQHPRIIVDGKKYDTDTLLSPPAPVEETSVAQPQTGTGVPADDAYMSEVYGDKQATQEYMESVYGEAPQETGPTTLDAVLTPYIEAKGGPLEPEEELAVGIEAIVEGWVSGSLDDAERDDLILELQDRFSIEEVQQALLLAMSPE